MRRVGAFAIALVVACGLAGAANATSHGLMPANLSFWDIVTWQVVHFRLHIDMVYAALIASVTKTPQTAWFMLSNQTLCAGTSPLTAFLFGSPSMALTTFFVTVLAPIGLLLLALHRAITMLGCRPFLKRPYFGYAPKLSVRALLPALDVAPELALA